MFMLTFYYCTVRDKNPVFDKHALCLAKSYINQLVV